ncbi:putative RNA-directed DNA polymerase from transposon BS [Orchesella cincta]|uniref:Putative RNA-directed DNA polymerase from transposon BS n=1 Tax=Orchesella cincta TaxID=48709 RepID=A0A1D2MVD4_ORCCI|nr:putative RNA-directed DNA polymerase from transposon BS [Orchesella cincta]
MNIITKLQVLALDLHKLFWFWIYPFPLKWNSNEGQLVLQKPIFKWIPWCFVVAMLGLVGTAYSYAAIKYAFISPRSDFHRINIIVFSMASAVMFCICVIAQVFLKTSNETVYFVNHMRQISCELLQDYRFPNLAKKQKTYGILLIAIETYLAMFPYVLLIICLITQSDVFYFILEYEFLPDPIIREINSIFLSYIIRVGLFLPTYLEVARSSAMFVSITLQLTESVEKIGLLHESGIGRIGNRVTSRIGYRENWESGYFTNRVSGESGYFTSIGFLHAVSYFAYAASVKSVMQYAMYLSLFRTTSSPLLPIFLLQPGWIWPIQERLHQSCGAPLNNQFVFHPKSSTKAIKLFSSLNFMQVVESATRGNNILDPVFINTSDIHKISEVIVVDEGISDHMLVSFCYSATRERWRKKRINYFDYRFTDWEGLTNFVVSECEKATTKSGCDEVLDLIIDIVKVGTEKFHYEMQSSGPQKGWFKMKLKVYTKLIAASMRKDFREMGDNLVRQHGVWKAMKKSNITFKKTCRLNPSVDANEINKYYCEMGFPTHVTPYDTMSNYKTPECAIQFQVKPVSSADVLKAWKKMKKKTDSNPDVTGISKLDLIVEVCNQSFSSGDVPVKCKLSRVIPIAKVENAINPDQYRPISLTPTILLLLERLYYDQLMEFIVENNVLTPYQFGFRKNHSTQLAMVALTDFVRSKVDSGLVCVIVSIDLRKAFDSVNRKKLLRKLARKFGISDHWLRSYLTESYSFVDERRVLGLFEVLAGVPAAVFLDQYCFPYF